MDRRVLLRRATLLGAAVYVAPAILDTFTPQTALAALSAPPCTAPATIDVTATYILNAQFYDATVQTQINVTADPFPTLTLAGSVYGGADDPIAGAGLTLSDGRLSGQTFSFTISGADGVLVDTRFDADTYVGTATTCGGADFSGSFTATGGTVGSFTLTRQS